MKRLWPRTEVGRVFDNRITSITTGHRPEYSKVFGLANENPPKRKSQIGSDQGADGRVSVKKVDASMKNTNEQPEQNAVGQQDRIRNQIQTQIQIQIQILRIRIAGARTPRTSSCTCTCQFGLW